MSRKYKTQMTQSKPDPNMLRSNRQCRSILWVNNERRLSVLGLVVLEQLHRLKLGRADGFQTYLSQCQRACGQGSTQRLCCHWTRSPRDCFTGSMEPQRPGTSSHSPHSSPSFHWNNNDSFLPLISCLFINTTSIDTPISHLEVPHVQPDVWGWCL